MMNANEARKITNAATEKKETLVKVLATIVDVIDSIHLQSMYGENRSWYEFKNTEKEICSLIGNLLVYKYGYTVKRLTENFIEIEW